jgi:hypothetical protein
MVAFSASRLVCPAIVADQADNLADFLGGLAKPLHHGRCAMHAVHGLARGGRGLRNLLADLSARCVQFLGGRSDSLRRRQGTRRGRIGRFRVAGDRDAGRRHRLSAFPQVGAER